MSAQAVDGISCRLTGCNHKENSTIGGRIWSDGTCWKEPSVLTDAFLKALKPKENDIKYPTATVRCAGHAERNLVI
jgi:hypothetical protein